jgi:hypothetical protein
MAQKLFQLKEIQFTFSFRSNKIFEFSSKTWKSKKFLFVTQSFLSDDNLVRFTLTREY